MHALTFSPIFTATVHPNSCRASFRRILIWVFVMLASMISAHAETVSIKWKPSQPMPWVPGNDYIDGHTFNFMNGTIEEKAKVKREGELEAELSVPKETKGSIPFVIILHGCSGMNKTLKKWTNEYGGKLVGAGYGVLVLDSFTSRGVGSDGICADPSQLEWARRRTDDAYSALDWLIENGKADPKRVYVLGRSNGATTSLIIVNKKIGDLHKNKFAAAFPMQPSCAYLKFVEFYAPVFQFLAEKDAACNPVVCADMAASNRPIPVQTKIWKSATHAYEDREPARFFSIAGKPIKMEYSAEANEGTIKAIINILNSYKN